VIKSAQSRARSIGPLVLQLRGVLAMTKQGISTQGAPAALGPYSQAVRVGRTVYLSGQIGLDPASGQLVEGLEAQTRRVFANLRAVAEASGGLLDHAVRVTIFLADLADFAKVNEIMASQFAQPYPTRSTVQVAALPKGARIEIDAILVLPELG